MPNKYEVLQGQDCLGPFSSAEVREMASSGTLHSDDRIRKVGTDKWFRARKIKSLLIDDSSTLSFHNTESLVEQTVATQDTVAREASNYNSLDIASVILGVVAILFSFSPSIGIIGITLATAGSVFALFGLIMVLARGGSYISFPITGIALNLSAIIVAVFITNALASFLAEPRAATISITDNVVEDTSSIESSSESLSVLPETETVSSEPAVDITKGTKPIDSQPDMVGFKPESQPTLIIGSGPFGLQKGMTLDDFAGNLRELAYGVYQINTVPKPHAAFDNYILRISPKEGLYYIKGIGKTIDSDSFGINLKLAFQNIEKKLTKKYGKHESIDRLLSGSIWDDSNDYMMSLLQDERIVYANWEADHGSTLDEHLQMIFLGISAKDTSSGYVNIEYYFDNADVAEKEMDEINDDGL
jgi:hypothetical protein